MLRTHRPFTLLVFVLMLCLLCSCQPIQAPPIQNTPSPASSPAPIPPTAAAPASAVSPKVELTAVTINSQALAGNLIGDPTMRRVFILLPPDYETSEERYPVVYVMPWGYGEAGANSATFAMAMQGLIRKGEIRDMIVVVPDGVNRFGPSLFWSSPALGDYERYATEELVDFVDTHYRTLPARESRGIAGCSNGGSSSMRLALKYPNIFSVAAPTGGSYDDSPEAWPADVESVRDLTELPQDFNDLYKSDVAGFYLEAAGTAAPEPDNPPFYGPMPFRIVDGHGEFVPEVTDKIAAMDPSHEVQRYLQQPERLRGILIQHGELDAETPVAIARNFDQLLTDLGVEHVYVEMEGRGHYDFPWEAATLKFMSEKLVFQEQE